VELRTTRTLHVRRRRDSSVDSRFHHTMQDQHVNARKILAATQRSPMNIRFTDLAKLLNALGFELDRRSGSHHIFKHAALSEIVNIQDVHGRAKPYQVRQVLGLVEKYDLHLGGSEA
jgi:predicted RNA binding protein YcfA (HicA-like mRNA interferase family)